MARVSNVVLLNQHPVEQALLRYFLSSEGVASSSLSPRAGLDALAAMAPDLVIADAAGAHGCAQLRQRLPGARIVALAEAGDVEGADAVLRRPLDFHRLNRDLRPLLEGGGKATSRIRRRVLLVDDDTDVLAVTRKALEAVGCTVTCIADSSEVLRAPPGDGYDLVLLDVMMPDVDGLELCCLLRQHYGEDVRICMITAATDPEAIKRAAQYGADGWLTKPIRKADLLALVGLGERGGPSADKGAIAVPAPFTPEPGAAPRRPHVLVVDDDRDVLEYCRAVLAGAGAVVDAIQDPATFRDLLPPGGSYDLVLIDIFMPGMDGIELLRRFSADVRNCASKLYVITAADDEALRSLANRSGADGYLTKPLKQKALLELLAS
jgi:DNA-binding response OmpR family regulator